MGNSQVSDRTDFARRCMPYTCPSSSYKWPVFDDPCYRRWVQLDIVADLGLTVPGVGEE